MYETVNEKEWRLVNASEIVIVQREDAGAHDWDQYLNTLIGLIEARGKWVTTITPVVRDGEEAVYLHIQRPSV